LPATPEEAERTAEDIGVIAKLAHQKEDKFIFELRRKIYQEYTDSEDQESEIVGTYNHLCERGFVSPLVLRLPMQCLLLQSGTKGVSDLPRPAEYI
jgi:hypothetical protein